MENAPAETTAGAAPPDTELPAESSLNGEEGGHPVLAGFNRLSIVRQIAVIGGIALVIALSIAILLWSQEPTYKPLVHRLQDHNAQDIIEILQQEGINFEIDPGSQILKSVPLSPSSLSPVSRRRPWGTSPRWACPCPRRT